MKCEKCKKDFAEGVKTAYKLGLQDGDRISQRTKTVIYQTNKALYDELLRLDKVNPSNANSVILSREQVEGIINALRKAHKNYQARNLTKIMNSQLGISGSSEAKLREILEHIEEEM